ncbi:MAG: response regulator [Acidimicrobiia bacterium]|nr:response regulator [Acidimicrobiia bacterium]
MHILVVADEDWVLKGVEAALGETRFEISTTSDPYAAVDACREAGADVVIADLQVGAMGGMAVIRNIRAAVDSGKLPRTPTVMLLDRGADAFIAGRAGADGSLRKPFGAFELRSLLDELVVAESASS